MFIRNKVKEIISEFGTNNPFEIIDILDITLVFIHYMIVLKDFCILKINIYSLIMIIYAKKKEQ